MPPLRRSVIKMKDTNIPLSLQASIDVAEEEYSTAKKHNSMLWTFTMILAITPTLVLLLLIAASPNIYDVYVIGVGGGLMFGVVGYIVLRKTAFPEAYKAATMRLQKYPELRKWRELQAGQKNVTEQVAVSDR